MRVRLLKIPPALRFQGLVVDPIGAGRLSLSYMRNAGGVSVDA